MIQPLDPKVETILERYADGKTTSANTILALRNIGYSAEAAYEIFRKFNLNRVKATAPAAQPEDDEWRKVPLGYIHEITTHRCVTCDSATHTSKLIAIRRAGSNSSIKTIVGLGMPIYSGVEMTEVTLEAKTRICQHCIASVPRKAQPPRPAHTTFKRGVQLGDKIDLKAPGKPKPQPFTADDIFNL